jgi:nitroimidazol reductase NimA-like FMN-containing flavoprotein (pyridoxamine 5'-phosphate oxidase superfamily)
VGRRVALRREQLGLSLDEVAERAGMAPSYVQYVEEQSDTIGSSALLRLAAALRTTGRQLLGVGPEHPAEALAPPPRTVLQELEPEDCWSRLSEHGVGCLALTTDAGPVVLPVSYAVIDGAIVYRTETGEAPAAAAGSEVAFEIDQVDDAIAAGWSVLAVGRAERVTPPEEEAAGKRELWIRIVPDQVRGCLIREAPEVREAGE